MPPHLVRTALLGLLATAVILPIGISLLVGLARLLAAMGDTAGAGGLDRVALALAVVWGVDLVCLILLQGFHLVGRDESHRTDDDSTDS